MIGKRTLFFSLLFLCGAWMFPARLSAHPDAEALPDTSGPLTFLVPEKLKKADFFPPGRKTPLFQKIEDVQRILADKKMPLTVDSVSVFQDGFLLHSNATPALVRYILKYKLLSDKLVWSEENKEDKSVQFKVETADKQLFFITFPKEKYLLVQPLIPMRAVPKFACPGLLKLVPDDALIAFLWPNPGGIPEYPLMGELQSISMYVRYLAGEPRPVYTEIVMPANSPESAAKIAAACKDFFDGVYKNASRLGKIPRSLVNAFVVSCSGDTAKIHVSLTDEHAKLFLTLFMTSLSNAIEPFALPDKLK